MSSTKSHGCCITVGRISAYYGSTHSSSFWLRSASWGCKKAQNSELHVFLLLPLEFCWVVRARFSFLDSIDRVTALGYIPSTGGYIVFISAIKSRTHRLQMTYYAYDCRQWALLNTLSMCKSVGNQYFGICTMLVVLAANGIHGFLTSTMQMRSFSWLLLALLIRLVRSICELYESADSVVIKQYLDEDPKMNRINDSLQLFTQICSNELLKKVHLVLFLSMFNRCFSHHRFLTAKHVTDKTDILRVKLSSGISVRK